MRGVRLPGGSRVEHVELPVPDPGPGQVLLAMRASGICGSDVRAIYREHLGTGAEAYRGVVAGHEPAGEVAAVGPGVERLAVGDRVAVYHIVGCGRCGECRRGYEIGCSSPARAAYGWQRDGGHADYLLAEERSCLVLPPALDFVDGSLVACGAGTAYEALLRLAVSGRDTLLVTGLGPVGLAAALLGRALGGGPVVGCDTDARRVETARARGLVDDAVVVDPDRTDTVRRLVDLTGGRGFDAAVECSGSGSARRTAVEALAVRGRCAFVGEGGEVTLDVSGALIHRQVTVVGSWVTSIPHMSELLDRLAAWEVHPGDLVTHRFPLRQASEAYAVAASGEGGKVVLEWAGDPAGDGAGDGAADGAAERDAGSTAGGPPGGRAGGTDWGA